METKKKILIVTPLHTDNLILQYNISIFEIINNKNNQFEINVIWRKGNNINHIKNELVSCFINSDYDYIFFIDNDIVDFVESFFKIVFKYISIEKEIPLLVLGGIYPIKHLNFDYINNLKELNDENWEQVMLNYNVNIKELGKDNLDILEKADKNDGLVEVQSISGGFMMFSKYVIEKFIEKYPESKYKAKNNETQNGIDNYNLFHSFIEDESKFYLNEDDGFCYYFKKMNGVLLANIKLKLSCYGEQIFKGSLYETLKINEMSKNN